MNESPHRISRHSVLLVMRERRLGEIGEAREFRLEGELHRAGRSVTLLGDDHVGRALHLVEQRFPFRDISDRRCRAAPSS
jgi:hypothetical protein